MKKTTKIYIAIICMIILSSCSVSNGIYFYFDDVYKHIYSDNNVQVLFYPIDNHYTGIFVNNNTDKIVFVDTGTSFLWTNNSVETIFKASSELRGHSSFTSDMSSVSIGGISSVSSISGVGSFQGDIISEKRIVPIAPKTIKCITAFSVIDYFVKYGIFEKLNIYRYVENGKSKVMKIGMGSVFNEDNSILKYRSSVRYSFKEDMSTYKDATTDNYLKAWVVDDKEGLYNYDNANLPYVNKYRRDASNYTLFNKYSSNGK